MFTINIGVYFEKGNVISNRKFKEYDCQIRKRVKSGENEEWWIIENDTDMEDLMESLQNVLGHIEKWFNNFTSKEETIHRILDRSAETFSDTMIMSYPTAKLIAEMGYSMEVYELIKDTRITNPKAIKLIEFADQLKSTIK